MLLYAYRMNISLMAEDLKNENNPSIHPLFRLIHFDKIGWSSGF